MLLIYCHFNSKIPTQQDVDRTLHLKGQMIYISQWNAILFLACPVMKDLNNLIWSGLFVNDLRLVNIVKRMLVIMLFEFKPLLSQQFSLVTIHVTEVAKNTTTNTLNSRTIAFNFNRSFGYIFSGDHCIIYSKYI